MTSFRQRNLRIKKVTKAGNRAKKRRHLERQDGLCGICGKPMEIEGGNFDHIVPIARGGKHKPCNIQLTHEECNARKGMKLQSEM